MNDYCEKDWFDKNKKRFDAEKNLVHKDFLKSYIDLRKLEITCGEAPFVVSCYDTVSGNSIPLYDRIGFLDKKLTAICHYINDEDEWFDWVCRVYQSCYGYEYQGDNLFKARLNLIQTFLDYHQKKWNNIGFPADKQLEKLSNIITRNFWQMDGLTYTVPNTDIKCKVYNWRTEKKMNIVGEDCMKFDYILGNPPYQETFGKSETQTQGNSKWIYQHFQNAADDMSKCSCLIYPFGGWFDNPSALGKFGEKLLCDKHTRMIKAYEGTKDKRAWYRTDKAPNPIFGENANLSAGVAIVLRDKKEHKTIEYSNRIYCDDVVNIEANNLDMITPNPLFSVINNKLGKDKLSGLLKKGLFGIESDFVEKNPTLVSNSPDGFKDPIMLLTNDKSGSSGRAKIFYIEKENIPKGKEYIDMYKVITTSAYPKQKFSSGKPTVENVRKRLGELIEIMPENSAFGRSRMAMFASKDEQECKNFLKYTQTDFFVGLTLQEPNRRSTFGDIIPLQDFSKNSDIDWSKSLFEINQQLYSKYNLTDIEIAFIEQREGDGIIE